MFSVEQRDAAWRLHNATRLLTRYVVESIVQRTTSDFTLQRAQNIKPRELFHAYTLRASTNGSSPRGIATTGHTPQRRLAASRARGGSDAGHSQRPAVQSEASGADMAVRTG